MAQSANGKHKTVETLEIEDEDARLERIQTTLERLNSSGSNAKTDISSNFFQFGRGESPSMQPPSELLSRVQAFLPQLEASNAVLAQKVQTDPKSVDIENIEDDEEQVIEMNLGLGVFEERGNASRSRGYSNSSSDDSTSSSTSDLDSDSSSDDSDASTTNIVISDLPSRPIRPLPRRSMPARPDIQVLSDNPNA